MNRVGTLLRAAGAILLTLGAASTVKGMAPMLHQSEAAPRDLNTPHLFSPPSSRSEWQSRAKQLRQQILFSAGLWPMPARNPLNPRVTGRIEGPDFTVENVALETWPGFYLCGNLYRPKGKKGPFPGIANPHGHWANGRLEMQPDVPRAEPGGPRGEGRGNLVAIGVNLARQGHVVFAYDMAGYNDTNQVDHRFAGGLRPWLWNVSLLGLQLWNSIRVVDYLQSLPDVDGKRIGATGASGGGSQTFLLAAVDDRVKVSVPVNMVSHTMQGGCLCENGPGLRVGTDNVEIGAMAAPRPQLLVSCTGDWTRENPTKEFPAIKAVYDLFHAADRPALVQFNYGHNYNVESREAMYAFFGRWLLGRSNGPRYEERPFDLDPKAMRVWTEASPMPADALKEGQLIDSWIANSERQLAALWPRSRAGLGRFRDTMLPALRSSLGIWPASLPGGRMKKGRATLIVAASPGAGQEMSDGLGTARDGRVETLVLEPVRQDPAKLWDAFFTCYNRTPVAERVNQIVLKLQEMARDQGAAEVDMAGAGEAGLWALLARAVSGVPGKTAVDVNQFPGDSDDAYVERLYAPGLRRAGDVRSAAILSAPSALLMHNLGDSFKTEQIEAGFRAVRAPLQLEKKLLAPAEVARWLLDN